jgi:hypothetical protein
MIYVIFCLSTLLFLLSIYNLRDFRRLSKERDDLSTELEKMETSRDFWQGANIRSGLRAAKAFDNAEQAHERARKAEAGKAKAEAELREFKHRVVERPRGADGRFLPRPDVEYDEAACERLLAMLEDGTVRLGL